MAKGKKNMSENSLKNLIPLEKGNTLGKGRPKGSQNVKTVLRKLLELESDELNLLTGIKEKLTVLERMNIRMIKNVLDGEQNAVPSYRAIIERYEGAVAPAETSGDETQPINFVSKENGPKLYEDESEITND